TVLGQTWERQSLYWRFATRQSGDWRSQETYNAVRNAAQLRAIEFGMPLLSYGVTLARKKPRL
ncbi:MAG TPA: hypothetical protein VFE02_02035, partial [Candidatus Acidoferrales bacterium]|nr:hypothetical protein [Candidatus Acidoferrales bacterium]